MISEKNNLNVEKEEVSIKELFFIIKSKIKIIFLFLFSFLFLGFIYLKLQKSTYDASGSIIIEAENSSVSSIFDMGLGSEKNYLDNEIQVLKSRTTSERAIKLLLNSNSRNNLHLFNTKKYNYSLTQKFLRKILLLDWNSKLIENIDESKIDSLTDIFAMTLQRNIIISNIRNTDVLKVSYNSFDSKEAALIVNTVISEYQKRDQEWANGEMSHLKYFLKEQLDLKEIDLNVVEQQLKLFQEEEHIYALDGNSDLLLKQLMAVETDYYNTEAKKNISTERKRFFENELSRDEKKFTDRVSNTLDVQLYSIRQELSALEADYISVKSIEGELHPAVTKLKNKILKLKSVLIKETKKYVKQGISVANPIENRQAIMDSVLSLDIYISSYNLKLFELNRLVKNYEVQLTSLPEKYLKFSRLQRDRAILEETYGLMRQKLEEVKINQASQLGKIRIVDVAKPSLYRSSPSAKIIILFSFLIGITSGVFYIFLREYLDSTIKSIEEIERRGLTLLGIIPAIGKINERKAKKKGYKINLKLTNPEKMERRLLTHEDPKSPISEAYRSLRTSLMFNKATKQGQIILVSSPGPGEGKTTTVSNLAITYANMGKKTLLIDADLRKPVLHKMFKSSHNLGLTNFLSGEEQKVNNLLIDSGVDNLKIITSGIIPPNPSEMLGSNNMNNFIEKVKEEFDIILFDTPPLIAVTDAFVITKFVDKFLLVVRASITQKGALERSIVNMKNMSHSIDGVIFNGVDESNTYGGGYYYNYYQYYYGNEEK